MVPISILLAVLVVTEVFCYLATDDSTHTISVAIYLLCMVVVFSASHIGNKISERNQDRIEEKEE